jgi:hypothetical protein
MDDPARIARGRVPNYVEEAERQGYKTGPPAGTFDDVVLIPF